MNEPTRHISYICPSCHQSIIVERTLFSLAAAPTQIPCPCGKSTLSVEFENDRVNLGVPCSLCKKDHAVSCTSESFLNARALAFSCSASGLDCCYVGEEGAVFAATAKLEQSLDKIQDAGEEKGAFLDEIVMEEVLSEIKDIAARGGISCTCGCKQWEMKVNYSSIDVSCFQCGAESRIPAATADDIDDICCKYTILLQSK